MKATLKLVLLGPPASGKGTQAHRLADHLGIQTVSTGVIIRREVDRGTPLGITAKRYLDAGRLLPDPDTLRLVSSWLDATAGDAFILDGFPRTLPQARAFDALLDQRGLALDAAVFLDVPRAILEQRILDRLQCPGCGRVFHKGDDHGPAEGDACPHCGARISRRDDDNLETFARRYSRFEAKTAPLAPYYARKKILKTIDGRGSPDKVMRAVLAALALGPGTA